MSIIDKTTPSNAPLGAYEVQDWPGIGKVVTYCTDYDPDGESLHCVLAIFTNDGIPADEVKANATLLAGAPVLAQAVRALVSECDDLDFNFLPEGDREVVKKALDILEMPERFRYIVVSCHEGSDIMVRRARQDEIDDPSEEIWSTNEEALEAARHWQQSWPTARIYDYGDEPPCENCGPNGTTGTCPRCYEETGLGCPHGDVCENCPNDEEAR